MPMPSEDMIRAIAGKKRSAWSAEPFRPGQTDGTAWSAEPYRPKQGEPSPFSAEPHFPKGQADVPDWRDFRAEPPAGGQDGKPFWEWVHGMADKAFHGDQPVAQPPAPEPEPTQVPVERGDALRKMEAESPGLFPYNTQQDAPPLTGMYAQGYDHPYTSDSASTVTKRGTPPMVFFHSNLMKELAKQMQAGNRG